MYNELYLARLEVVVELSGSILISRRLLKLFAALVWCGGVIALGIKASQLLMEAYTLRPGGTGVWITLICGLAAGGLKGELFFTRSCKKNLDRIDGLDRPRWYQFFRPGFFLFLISMICLGAILSRLAHGNYPLLLTVAFVDISVAAALLLSSRCFLR